MTASSPPSPAPLTRWRRRWSCSARRWPRSGCASGCTPAKSNCATKATTPARPSTGPRRLRDLGHGGQTLLSGATEALVLDGLPADDAWLTDLGTHTLRGVHTPGTGRPAVPSRPGQRISAAARAKAVVSKHLPAQFTSFVGREAEIAQVRELLSRVTGLVTLTGAGGVGKTRSARRSQHNSPASSATVFGRWIWRRSPIPICVPDHRGACVRAARAARPLHDGHAALVCRATVRCWWCWTTVSTCSTRAPRWSPHCWKPQRG